ncbi:MAG: FadR/GntR family transcriptional regulator [Burkholderiales bacterium]
MSLTTDAPPNWVVAPGGDQQPAPTLWEPVQSDTLSWRIVSQVRNAVFADKLKPGDFLGTEGSIARDFGVSRMAARDALRSLAAVGIVTIRAGAKGGAVIAQGNAEHFADALAVQLKLIGISGSEMLDAQIGIEAMAAELAARQATPEDMTLLRGLVEELKRLTDKPDEFTVLSMRFHLGVVEASHNRALIAQFRALRHVLLPAYAKHTTREIALRAVEAHILLLGHIERRDADAAREQMVKRLRLIRAHRFAPETAAH